MTHSKYRASGTVTFRITTELDEMSLPSYDEAVAALQSVNESYEDLSFSDVTVLLKSNARVHVDKETGTGELEEVAKSSLGNIEKMPPLRITGVTEQQVTETLWGNTTPVDDRVRTVLADATPASVLSIESIEVETVEKVGLD